MKTNERLDALRVLSKLLQEKIPLSHLMQTNALSPLSKDICFGVCRHYFRLQALADLLLKKRPKEFEIWLTILIGLYQLHFQNAPDYAVVKETVSLVEELKKTWAKGLINAVLRTYCRERETLLTRLNQNITFHNGHPQWLIARIKKAWPKHWQAILAANDIHPPMTLRVNANINPDDYLLRLKALGITGYRHPHAPQAITLDSPCDVRTLPGFSDGEISVQDAAAQMAAPLLALEANMHILDACCAPGGKTCHLLETQPNIYCTALDVEKNRLTRVQENLARLKLNAVLKQGDASDPTAWWDGKLFDRILLDAPCSAIGVIRRHPDIKLLRTEEEITAITQLQEKILHALWPLLTPGGLLVYATCSILPQENEDQIAKFIANNTNCEFVKHSLPWGHATQHGWQIFPGEENMDGFFYSVLKKL